MNGRSPRAKDCILSSVFVPSSLETLSRRTETHDEAETILRKVVPPRGGGSPTSTTTGTTGSTTSWWRRSPRAGEFRYPVWLAGRRACPREDCGGPWSYGEMRQALQDPEHPEHEECLGWLGGELDPEGFDLDELSRRLTSPDTCAAWDHPE